MSKPFAYLTEEQRRNAWLFDPTVAKPLEDAIRAGRQMVPLSKEQFQTLLIWLHTATDSRNLPMRAEYEMVDTNGETKASFLVSLPVFYCEWEKPE